MADPLLVTFSGGAVGEWAVVSTRVLVGEPIDLVPRVSMTATPVNAAALALQPESVAWSLRGVVSHIRYATQSELTGLKAIQPGLGRSEASCAALIPIKKSAEWWALSQDERRAIFEETSNHTRIGMDYLPAIARRLHHSRDIGEPFDFLTWFEFSPEHSSAFDALLARLRETEEWRYVVREIELRLVQA